MSKLIQLEYDGGKIWVESSEVGYGGILEQASAIEVAEKSIEKMLGVLKPFCDGLKKSVNSLGENRPDSYSAELGLSFSGEGNVFFARFLGKPLFRLSSIGEIHEPAYS
ncbi:MAG: hypothetical protein DLM72_09990 [Candidatus Nitrosopolaris wilkensis]|nr:MAG: hypothetical protein DLM72_09990 [Candidatus Nitrosopolaris wilkensis]